MNAKSTRLAGFNIEELLGDNAIPQRHHEFVAIDSPDFTIDVALVSLCESSNPNVARLTSCIPEIRKPIM